MHNNKKNRRKGVIYSTNNKYEFDYESEEIKELNPEDQILYIHLENNGRGKKAVIIKNFKGEKSSLKILSKLIKNKCGVGGSIKNGEIMIQGNIRDKIIKVLENQGYNYKRVGG